MLCFVDGRWPMASGVPTCGDHRFECWCLKRKWWRHRGSKRKQEKWRKNDRDKEIKRDEEKRKEKKIIKNRWRKN